MRLVSRSELVKILINCDICELNQIARALGDTDSPLQVVEDDDPRLVDPDAANSLTVITLSSPVRRAFRDRGPAIVLKADENTRLYAVLNVDKTLGFLTTDAGVSYEARKGSETNCYSQDGVRCHTAVGFCEDVGEETAERFLVEHLVLKPV